MRVVGQIGEMEKYLHFVNFFIDKQAEKLYNCLCNQGITDIMEL